MFAADPIRSTKDLKKLANYFLSREEYRNYVLVVLGAHSTLRISDLLKLRWEDVYDFELGKFRKYIELIEKKTGKPKRIAIHKKALEALRLYFKYHSGEYIFSNGRRNEKPIGRVQAWRILRMAVLSLGIPGRISCHSLRKTWGYHAAVVGRVKPAVLMQVFNHSSWEVTRRYLGITQDELDTAYLSVSLF